MSLDLTGDNSTLVHVIDWYKPSSEQMLEQSYVVIWGHHNELTYVLTPFVSWYFAWFPRWRFLRLQIFIRNHWPPKNLGKRVYNPCCHQCVCWFPAVTYEHISWNKCRSRIHTGLALNTIMYMVIWFGLASSFAWSLCTAGCHVQRPWVICWGKNVGKKTVSNDAILIG